MSLKQKPDSRCNLEFQFLSDHDLRRDRKWFCSFSCSLISLISSRKFVILPATCQNNRAYFNSFNQSGTKPIVTCVFPALIAGRRWHVFPRVDMVARVFWFRDLTGSLHAWLARCDNFGFTSVTVIRKPHKIQYPKNKTHCCLPLYLSRSVAVYP